MKHHLLEMTESVKKIASECCRLLESNTGDVDMIVSKMIEQNGLIEKMMKLVESKEDYDHVMTLVGAFFEREKLALVPYRDTFHQLKVSLSKVRKLDQYQDSN